MNPKIIIHGERHQTKITIQTRKCTDIDNVQEHDLTPFYLHQVEELNKEYEGTPVTFVNNASPIYNCHGLTFGSRRSMIWEPQEIMKIIEEDDYVMVDMKDVREGDIIIYFADNGDAEHSGLVIGEELGLPLILSKWGPGREAVHIYVQCPYKSDNVRFYRISK